jgi:S-adenosylmethionine uptake transporter
VTAAAAGRASPLVPFAVACLGIAIFCCMDALMKALGLAMGAYSALFWRSAAGVVVTGGAFLLARGGWPPAARLRLHIGRGLVVAAMASLWFHGITLIPLAEAIAISFVAPLLAIYLAALFLGEAVRRQALAGSALALVGVAVILVGKFGQPHRADAGLGVAAVLASALLYAVNLVLQRHQAQRAGPAEIAFFQTGTVLACLLPFAPWAAVRPDADQWPLVAGAAVLASCSLLLLSWAYARAQAQQLVATEYTGFVWLSILGAVFFGEALTLALVAGAGSIVSGCLLAIRSAPGEPQEAML